MPASPTSIPPHAELTQDERHILRFVRALGLSFEDVVGSLRGPKITTPKPHGLRLFTDSQGGSR